MIWLFRALRQALFNPICLYDVFCLWNGLGCCWKDRGYEEVTMIIAKSNRTGDLWLLAPQGRRTLAPRFLRRSLHSPTSGLLHGNVHRPLDRKSVSCTGRCLFRILDGWDTAFSADMVCDFEELVDLVSGHQFGMSHHSLDESVCNVPSHRSTDLDHGDDHPREA